MIKGNKENNEQKHVDFACEVMRAKKFDDGGILFDLSVNGVIIHGMKYREYVTKEGKEGSMLILPSYKKESGEEVKWYTHVWFPISRELQQDIEKKISARLGE